MRTPSTAGVGYLVSNYPTVSQTFIRREVEALRRAGVRIETFAIWPAPDEEVLSEDDEEARRTTTYVMSGNRRFRRLLHALLVTPPSALVRTILLAWSLGSGLRGRVWQLAYAIEALLLHDHLRARDLRHIHVHFANNAADVARLAVVLGRATARGARSWSFTMHGPTEFADLRHFDLARKARDAAFVVAISDFARSQLLALLPHELWDRVVVVRCGLSGRDALRPAPRRVEPSAGAASGSLRVLCIGRLVPEKGQAVLLRAAAILKRRGCQPTLTFVGDGPSRADLEHLAVELGLENVEFCGALGPQKVAAALGAADVFCLPSFAEGLPVVIMEAMLSGVPVVSTAIAGVPELVVDGVTGLLIPAGRDDLCAEAIDRLHDPGLRSSLARAALVEVRRLHDVDQSAARLRGLFSSYAAPAVVGSPRPASAPSSSR